MTTTTKIGIIDDHEWFRKTVTDLITIHLPDFIVTIEASNGKDFIDKLKLIEPKDLPDIVVMDINMPVMDGFETAKWLHRHYPSIKILALTLNYGDGPIIRMLALGAAGYLRKNIDAPELLSAIKSVDTQGYYYAEDNIQQHLSSSVIVNASRIVWDSLSGKEKEFVKQCCSEQTYQEIAVTMKINTGSLDTMRERLFSNLKVRTRIGLVIWALRNDFV
jgi:DNA-binding NarL/FixJ family response regulator